MLVLKVQHLLQRDLLWLGVLPKVCVRSLVHHYQEHIGFLEFGASLRQLLTILVVAHLLDESSIHLEVNDQDRIL
jgi:hypothetical protein